MIRAVAILLAALAATPAAAEAVPVRVIWDGSDQLGGILANRVRGLLAASIDKRETLQPGPGVAVLLQTIDPTAEFAATMPGAAQMTVYSLIVNVRRADAAADTFGTAALGYCASSELASCAREIVTEIDDEIIRRGLR